MDDTGKRAGIGGLGLEACVVLAEADMSAAEADRATRTGALSMRRPDGALAWLEVGGVAIAEGRISRRRGKLGFTVTRMYKEAGR